MRLSNNMTTHHNTHCRAARLILVMLACTGCSSEVQTWYGQRSGTGASKSVNGTAVLGEMFEQAGHKVFSWRTLSPTVQDRADCIVWFPNDFQPPGEDVLRWLEDWLDAKPDRTLIYVGRDFDAAGGYWEAVEPDAPPEQLPLVRRRKAAAKREFRRARQEIPDSEDCEWFTVNGKYQPRKVRTLTGGDPEWLEGIDPSKLEIELRGRIIPDPAAEVLLESEGDVLISRELAYGPPWCESKLIVVTNGSFLLNLPLVNHEHRKLAGRLIEEVGPPSKTVVFLESYAGGPPISDEDPSATTPTGLEIVLISPLCWIFLHLAVVGVLFCFSRWPIFGLPRQFQRDSTSDFGKHIRALADLLERSRDRAYAMSRFLHYQQTTKGVE